MAVLVLVASAIGWSMLPRSGELSGGETLLTVQLIALPMIGLWALWRMTKARALLPADSLVPAAAIVDLVTRHDAFGDVLFASDAAQAVLGLSPHGLVGTGLMARVHVSDRPLYLKALSDAANGDHPVTVGFRLHSERLDESGWPAILWAEMRAHRIASDAPSSGPVVVAFTRDVSAQHRHADELEAARLDAEKANELKGRFLATVSHELRTPLNAIIGFSELLSADHPFLVTEERRREYAGIIRSSGLHLLEIVNTLLDMSKIESGNFTFEPEPFPIGDLAKSVCDLMQLKADEAGIVVERRFGGTLPDITADRRACRQVLINLLSNAVKFTPRGGQVEVSVRATADSIVLAVSDSGIGIPEADLPRLGDPFFQSGDVHRRGHEGTGLGLSVVRGIVGLHRGQITVESGQGAGTTVTVTLPLRPELGPAHNKPVVVQTRPRVAQRTAERKIA